MDALFQALHHRANSWRAAGYECPDYPAIEEILGFQVDPEPGVPRFLRHAQIETHPRREWAEIDRFGNGFAVLGLAV